MKIMSRSKTVINVGFRHFCSSVTVRQTNVLVINSGSSTVKFQLLDPNTNKVFTAGLIERIGTAEAVMKWKHGDQKQKMVEKLGPNVNSHYEEAFQNIAKKAKFWAHPSSLPFFEYSNRTYY